MGASGLTWVGRVTGAAGLGVLSLALPAAPALARPPLQAVTDTATIGLAQGVASGNVLSNDIGPDGKAASVLTVGVDTSPFGAQAGNLRLSPSGAFTYSPGACFVGTASIGYRIIDQSDSSNTDTGTINITVPEFFSAPLARSDSARVGASGVVQGNLLGNDCGPGAQASAGSVLLSATPVSGPNKGSVIIDTSSGTFTYQARAGAAGSDSFRYRISNRVNPELASTATVSITIAAPAPPPAGGGNNGGNNGGSSGGTGGGPSTGGAGSGRPGTGTPGGAGRLQPPADQGAGGFAAPRPQLSATGPRQLLPTTAVGFGLVLSGIACLIGARRRQPETAADTAAATT